MSASGVVWQHVGPDRAARWSADRLVGCTVWLTGLPGAGKSTLAARAADLLLAQGRAVYVLDGDNLRHGLNADLGFDRASRAENVRRVGEVACLLADAGLVALAPLVSPYRDDRDRVRTLHVAAGLPFLECYVATPLSVCEARDPKGLYRRARAGTLLGLTGVDDVYEPPCGADLVLDSTDDAATDLARRIADAVVRRTLREGTPRLGS